MENDLKGNENYFELTGGSSYRGFELPGVDCILRWKLACIFLNSYAKVKKDNLV